MKPYSNALIATLLAAIATSPAMADESRVDYKPAIHGALRARYEYSTADGKGRFQMRNARLQLSGAIAPSVSYFIQTDLCDRGSMKILDAWGKLGLWQSLALQAGQFRLPFGTDCFRAPGNYIFPNHSFVGIEMNNVRGVGAKLSYTFTLPGSTLSLDGGAFNPTSITDQNVWVSTLAYAAKAQLSTGNVTIATGFQTIVPDSVRTNLTGASVNWTCGHWIVEGEYIYKHYTHNRHKSTHGYNLWADYHFPVKAGVFRQASFQARFDGMTDHSTAVRDSKGLLLTNHPGRNRVTAGGTLTYLATRVRCDVKLSYEKYFYRRSVTPAMGDNDRICAELVVKF